MNFTYEHRFGSFFPCTHNIHVTRKSCRNNVRTKTHAYKVDEIDTWNLVSPTCLGAAFSHKDPKIAKRQSNHQCIFANLGSMLAKAAQKNW